MIAWVSFGLAFLICLLMIPGLRQVCFRLGWVALPRADRWHSQATPTMGGIAVFSAFTLSLSASLLALQLGVAHLSSQPIGQFNLQSWGFLAGSLVIFGLGVLDDIKHISPQAKLIGQISAAAIVILFGSTTNFFTPILSNSLLADFLNLLLTFLWLVGITNAINLLDNMDGLAGGIVLITTGLLAFLFWRAGNAGLVLVCLALMGANLGFLWFNFPPARLFMGDSGSMFLGFTLAALAIARQPQASNVFAILAVPSLLFLLPILDTLLVTITRLLRGASPVQGGRDHTSHRLIAFGFKERQVLVILYTAALLSGVLAVMIESAGYRLSLILVPILVAAFALAAAYLGGVKISPPSEKNDLIALEHPVIPDGSEVRSPSLAQIVLNLTFKRRLLEVSLDFVIILLAFYLSFVTRYGLNLSEERIGYFLQALPVALVVGYLSFFLNGVYRGVWRYVGVDESIYYFRASLSAVVVSALLIYSLYALRAANTAGAEAPPPMAAYSSALFLLFGVFLFLGLAMSRSSFRVLDRLFSLPARSAEEKVLIIGAGDAGEIALRWILMHPSLNYRPVGFIDEDPLKIGRSIHGVEVLGSVAQLEKILERQPVKGMILTGGDQAAGAAQARQIAASHGCWLRVFRLDFELQD